MRIGTIVWGVGLSVLGFTVSAYSQEKASDSKAVVAAEKEQSARLVPTVANFAYGQDSPRQVFDFWKADSKQPTPEFPTMQSFLIAKLRRPLP